MTVPVSPENCPAVSRSGTAISLRDRLRGNFVRIAKPFVFLLCLMPALLLVHGVVFEPELLGANPAEYLIRATGDWTLRGLCLGLAITPVRVQWGWPELARFRRLLGLLTYLYACLHLICYVLFDMGLDLQEIALDVLKRPFILVGTAAWLAMPTRRKVWAR